MLYWLIHSDRLSAVRGECCTLGRSADAGLTANEKFKSRHCYHRFDETSQRNTNGKDKQETLKYTSLCVRGTSYQKKTKKKVFLTFSGINSCRELNYNLINTELAYLLSVYLECLISTETLF